MSWQPLLKKSFDENYGASNKSPNPIYITSAAMSSTGLKLLQIVFQDFSQDDVRALIFSGATRNPKLMSIVKGNQTHELHWTRPKTGETFQLSGKMFIVAEPSLLHRFGSPPRTININPSVTSAEEYWEGERLRIWKTLSPAYRASFSWPASGEYRYKSSANASENAPKSYVMRLDVPTGAVDPERVTLRTLSSYQNSSEDPGNAAVYHDAFNNFCLLVFKVVEVYIQPSTKSLPTRKLFKQFKDGEWYEEEVFP